MLPATRLVCGGCGRGVDPRADAPFRCPAARAGDGIDHVLARQLEPAHLGADREARQLFLHDEPLPFRRYRRLLHSYQTATVVGRRSDAEYAALVTRLDAAVAAVDGRGFRDTPFAPRPALAAALGLGEAGELWVKDETGNVSGSHKGRHFFGLALWLATHPLSSEAPFAVASCGNAALAAAVVARAVGRALRVFIPPDAEPAVVARLQALGAELAVCPRRAGESGDPCYLRYREAIAGGAIPFTCQGNENALVIEGGETLAWEMISELLRAGRELDHLVVQVGGGALASACVQAFAEARALGVLDRLPRLHTVQTASAHPLERAYERVVERAVAAVLPGSAGSAAPREPLARALWLRETAPESAIAGALRFAANHRAAFMSPWESTPHSVAHGILDDETYDWLAVVKGMLATGGVPVTVDEATLVEANDLAVRSTGIAADETGTAGLAGALALARAGAFAPGDRVAVLFTGVRR